ncbi:hypothetical protein ANN_26972 [Periplaneta americana]|uniref:Uncharacterized protein n=1 Tax=Periplaneta americana TaxID=6978 RepID=A0ABQ8RWR2_PERAM|nr:hypothetical protein ANN_26972 [Periplaneta americana]
MSPGSSTESYPAFAHLGLRENLGKNLNQVTCPDRESNPGHLVSRPDALTVTPQWDAGSVVVLSRSRLVLVALQPFILAPSPHETDDNGSGFTWLGWESMRYTDVRDVLAASNGYTLFYFKECMKLTGFLEFGNDAATLPPRGFDGHLSILLNEGCDWLLTREDKISVIVRKTFIYDNQLVGGSRRSDQRRLGLLWPLFPILGYHTVDVYAYLDWLSVSTRGAYNRSKSIGKREEVISVTPSRRLRRLPAGLKLLSDAGGEERRGEERRGEERRGEERRGEERRGEGGGRGEESREGGVE